MAIIKCKMCGGDMDIAADKTFGTCEYCGSTMTLPKVEDDQRAAAFNRGNHFRRVGEFDKALAVYERIVTENDADAEAHWCCALCRFGIEYVEDPTTFEWLPTCHRASFNSFLEDVDYLAALEHSDGITKRQYQKDAAKIAEVQRGILATSQNEKPFDVFICYKESGEDGSRTRDSLLAQDIYYQLTEQGRRVFFARITLEDKGGAEYEPYIFAALNSAKVMIAVGTRPEHFNAVWVKNEWSRFLSLMKKDHSKLLLPCYRDMDPYDLPEALSVLQSYDMAKIGFIQDLIRGVNKVLDAEKGKQQSAPAAPVTTQVVQTGNANITALIKRGNMALEDGEWKKADEFFDRVLDMDAECAEAYLGKSLADYKVASLDQLEKKLDAASFSVQSVQLKAGEPDPEAERKIAEEYALDGYLTEAEILRALEFSFKYSSQTHSWEEEKREIQADMEDDRNLSRAMSYGKKELQLRIRQAKDAILASFDKMVAQSRAEDEASAAAVMQRYAEHLKNPLQVKTLRKKAENTRQEDLRKEEEAREADYQNALALLEDHIFRDAMIIFQRLAEIGYRDAEELVEECSRLRLKQKEKEEKAAQEWQRQIELAQAQELRKQQAAAAKKKKLTIIGVAALVLTIVISLLMTLVIIPGIKYKTAEKQFANGQYEEAAAGFAALEDYKDAKSRASESYYAQAEALIANGQQREAMAAYRSAVSYQNARQQYAALLGEIPYISAGGLHTVGLKSDGTVVAVGESYFGQCDVSSWTDIVAISAGSFHTVGLKSDGTVVAVGDNEYDQCDVSSWTDIVAISAGDDHTVGLKSDGTVVAVGSNGSGRCDVSSWTDIVAISAGNDHTVGLKSDGTVVAVGSNGSGRCDVSSWTDIVAISAGNDHTVGLKSDGTVVAVGYNKYDQCDVSSWTDIVAISAGGVHTVGLKSDGTVAAVGDSDGGECDVSSWTDIVAISAGTYHTVGLKSDGTVVAVGDNFFGQCYASSWTDIWVPKK